MAEKFNEHVLKVKAGLDKASQQEMREAMRSIFVDEAHIDFNNPENIKGLRELAGVMKKIFAQAGNTKFDFTNMIKLPGPEMFGELKKAALEFDKVWSSIVTKMNNTGNSIVHDISDGIINGVSAGVDAALKEAETKLNGLLEKQAQKIKQIEELGDKQRKKEDMARRLDFDNAFDIDSKITYSDDADLKRRVREIESVYENALVNLQDAMDTGKVTEPVLEKFRDAAKEMLKVKNTIADLMEQQVKQVDKKNGGMMVSSKYISKAESLFGSQFVERLFGDDEETLNSEIGQAMDFFADYFDNFDIRQQISDVKKELTGINGEIEKLTSQHPELINRQSAAEAEERLQKIQEAYERLFSSRGDTKGQLKERDLKHIENTLGYAGHGDKIKALPSDATAEQTARYKKVTTEIRKKLEDAFRLYDESTNDSWEKRAQYLIKAVAEYESILNNPNADKTLLDGYEDKYKTLSGQVAAERERLEAVVAMARSVATSDAIINNINPTDSDAKARAAQIEAEAAEKKRQAEEAAAKAREKNSYQSGSILGNPMFANMFKKANTDTAEDSADKINDSLSEQNGLLENIQKLTTYIDDEYLSAGKHLADFLDDLQSESFELDSELKKILTTLNLIDEKGNLAFEVRRNGEAGGGTTHNGALIGDDFVLIERGDFEKVKNSGLPNATKDASKDGVNVAEVLGYLPSKYTKGFFDVQDVVNGNNLFENGVLSQDVVNATDEQLEQLVDAFIKARNYGFDIENGGSNVVYDKEKGFSFYDLEELPGDEKAFWDSLSESEKKLDAIGNLFALFSDLNRDHTNYDADKNIGGFAERLKTLIENNSIVKPSEVDRSGRNYEDIFDDTFGGYDEADYEDFVAQLQAEANIHKQNTDAIQEQAAAQETLNDVRNQNVGVGAGDASSTELEAERAKAESLQNELDKKKSELAEKDNELQRVISEKDSAIQAVNEEKQTLQNDLDATEQLNSNVRRELLDARADILYAERRADEAEERVSQLEQRLLEYSSGEKQHSLVDTDNADTIAGTALDSRLMEIKSVLESINQKIVDGGKIINREGAKQTYKESQKASRQEQTARSNVMKSLINDYKTMGKLAAQFASDENLETRAMLDNLKEEITRKRQSLKITMDENKSLREKYSNAFNAEKRLLDAAKAQEEINKKNKQATQDEKNTWKKRVKDAQRETGINAADSIYRATNNTVIRAIGAEGISADIEAKAKELAEQNKTLNDLRNSIHTKGVEASEKDREYLSKQIVKVKELKTEVDGYLKVHQKYSGEGATQFNNIDTSNFGAVGTNQYWNSITAAIKGVSEGRVIINGMNADTGELTGTTKIAANTFAEWSAVVDPLTGKLSMVRTGIKKTETLIESITRKTKEVFTYFSGSSIIFKAFNELKKGVQYVREIDSALTELKKVTNETEEAYDKFLKTAAKTAEKVGSTIKDVVSSTADWARLGYSMEAAAKFAETTQILMNVSEFTDVSQATDTLISAVQAFGYTADTSMEVVDLLNTIGNNYAISTADLAQSLTKSSASLVAAGGDLAEAAALTATANKIIQDADSVGTALKTTSLRLRGTEISVLEEEGLDSEGAVTSKSKLQSKVKALSGVDILTATGEYKSTYEILRDIADVWESINDMDQAECCLNVQKCA